MAIPDEPLTRAEQYLNRTATGGGTIPEEPLTRAEMYLNKIATGSGNTPDEPLTRMEQYLDYIAENGGGGGDITLRTLNVTQNGTTNAPSGEAYNKVVANVPNSYAASDEGKVVSNGALVAQTAHAEVVANGTIDTTSNNSVVVNVPSGWTTDGIADGSEPNGDFVVNSTAVSNYAFAYRTRLGKVSFPNLIYLSRGLFFGANFDSVFLTGLANPSTSPNSFMASATGNVAVVKDLVQMGGWTDMFSNANIKVIDFGALTSIGDNVFSGTATSEVIIFRRTSGVVSISNNNRILNSAVVQQLTIYVPQALISAYQTATNWSTAYSYNSNLFQPIEGSIYETKYADGTPIT